MKIRLRWKWSGFALSLVVGLALLSSVAFAAERMIFSGYGGLWENGMREYVIQPFEKKFDARVVLDTAGTSPEKLGKS